MNKIKDILVPYFTKDFILNKAPQINDKIVLGLAIFFGTIFLLGFLINFLLSTKAKKMAPIGDLKDKLTTNFIAFGIIGLLCAFFIWQQIPYLSAPILAYSLILVFLVNIGYNIVYWRKYTIPAIGKFKQEAKYKKYLPKQNKI